MKLHLVSCCSARCQQKPWNSFAVWPNTLSVILSSPTSLSLRWIRSSLNIKKCLSHDAPVNWLFQVSSPQSGDSNWANLLHREILANSYNKSFSICILGFSSLKLASGGRWRWTVAREIYWRLGLEFIISRWLIFFFFGIVRIVFSNIYSWVAWWCSG